MSSSFHLALPAGDLKETVKQTKTSTIEGN